MGLDENDSCEVYEHPQLDSIWSDDLFNTFLKDSSSIYDAEDLKCGEFSKSFMDWVFKDDSDENDDANAWNFSKEPLVEYTEAQVQQADCSLDRMRQNILNVTEKSVLGEEVCVMIEKLPEMFESLISLLNLKELSRGGKFVYINNFGPSCKIKHGLESKLRASKKERRNFTVDL